MHAEGASLYSVDPNQSHLIYASHQAIVIMKDILPKTFFGTLDLVSGVVIVRGGITSGYINENPGSFFISAGQFECPYVLGETLLHEALHEKMAQIRLTSNLINPSYDDFKSEMIGDVLVPWPDKNSPRRWSTARALAALHVYCHTCVYYFLLLQRYEINGVDKKEMNNLFKTHFERANYLTDAISMAHCTQFLDFDGLQFLDWLQDILSPIRQFFNSERDLLHVTQNWSAYDLQQRYN